MEPRPAPVPALTGVRFVAALHVVLYHYFTPLAPDGPLRAVLHSGYAGVSLFFVLSGWILACNYADPLARGATSPRAF